MSISLYLGKSGQGVSLWWDSPTNSHAFISGVSGQGKSFFLESLIRQLPVQGVRCIILDASHDWASSTFTAEEADALGLQVIDAKSEAFSIAPLQSLKLSAHHREDNADVAFRLTETLVTVCRMTSSAQEVYLPDAVLAFLENPQGPRDIKGLIRFIEGDKKYSDLAANSVYRLKHLERAVKCAERSFQWPLDTPGISVLDFSRITTEMQQALLIELVVSDLWAQRTSHNSKVPVVLVIDECQKVRFFENSFLVKLLREGRKYGIGGWFSSQWVKDKVALGALNQAAFRAYFNPGSDYLQSLAKTLGGCRQVSGSQLQPSTLPVGPGTVSVSFRRGPPHRGPCEALMQMDPDRFGIWVIYYNNVLPVVWKWGERPILYILTMQEGRCWRMVMDRNDEQRYIDIWLRADETAPDLTDLRQRFPGYQIVVWHSGRRNLGELTAQLLQVNCRERV